MQANRGENTVPEMVVRRLLHALGYRYRLHRRDLPGKPDIAFAGRRKVVEIRGCFWHGHGCFPLGQPPKSRTTYWVPKIATTKARDERNMTALRAADWKVLEIWECRVRAAPEEILAELISFLGPVRVEIPEASRESSARCRAD
jgi:DNA mismatch endonuclease, patch repair protein